MAVAEPQWADKAQVQKNGSSSKAQVTPKFG